MAKRPYFFDGMIIGALIGIVAGLLFAPHSGEETRKKIRKAADDTLPCDTDSAGKTENMIEKTMDAIDRGFEKLSKMVDDHHPKPTAKEAAESKPSKEKSA